MKTIYGDSLRRMERARMKYQMKYQTDGPLSDKAWTALLVALFIVMAILGYLGWL